MPTWFFAGDSNTRTGHSTPVGQSTTLLPVEVIEAPIELPPPTSLPQQLHSEILIEVGTATVCVCFASVWNKAASFGHKQPAVAFR